MSVLNRKRKVLRRSPGGVLTIDPGDKLSCNSCNDLSLAGNIRTLHEKYTEKSEPKAHPESQLHAPNSLDNVKFPAFEMGQSTTMRTAWVNIFLSGLDSRANDSELLWIILLAVDIWKRTGQILLQNQNRANAAIVYRLRWREPALRVAITRQRCRFRGGGTTCLLRLLLVSRLTATLSSQRRKLEEDRFTWMLSLWFKTWESLLCHIDAPFDRGYLPVGCPCWKMKLEAQSSRCQVINQLSCQSFSDNYIGHIVAEYAE